MKNWENYEEVARYLLDQFAEEFGLQRVEGKQALIGKESGTIWTIDAKGCREGDEGFVIVECRRRSSRQKQEDLAALAYRIRDTGASGGILVSPMELQAGAKKVANASNVIHVQLGAESTTENYVLSFLKKIFVTVTDKMTPVETGWLEFTDPDGKATRSDLS